MDEEDT
ncbi:hypothetical protein E2C01_082198 [Portunus trituberculatus]|nr:hypothetical protein [Portunus trituberculatus]